MKKKSDFDFSIPRRQSYVSILIIIWKTYKIIVRQVFPFLILFFIGKSSKSNYGNYVIYFIIMVALIGMVYSILSFFRYYYYIEDDKLIVDRGVFGKSKTSIPFERIQTINFEQNIAHQVFSTLRLKIDTAGSAKKEFEFDAIQKEEAYALRALVLDFKASTSKKYLDQELITEDQNESTTTYNSVLKLSVTDLLKVGITENHLRSGGLIIFALWWVWDSLDEVGVNLEEYTGEVDPLAYGILMMGLGILLFMFLSFIISLVRTVLNYYDLEFLRSKVGFKLRSGLLTKKDTSALDHKIQMISWSDNLLQKLIGYFDLQLKQASSIEINNKSSITIPGCRQEHIDLVTTALYGREAFLDINFESVDIRFMYRRMFFLSLIGIVITALGYFTDAPLFGIGIFIFVYFIVSSYYRYKKIRFGHNDQMLVIKGGLFGDKIEALPLYKMQNIKIYQSPYQHRKNLANIRIHTAAGRVTIPYISLSRAIELSDYLLYKTESSRKKWM